MEMDIMVPDEVPVMTLPNLVFFPQALLPLHIYEPRYRQMLRDVLSTNRLFAVAGLDTCRRSDDPQAFEPPHRVASIGLVQACRKNDDGTANLLLQGLCRIEVLGIKCEEPYRRVQIRPLVSKEVGNPTENQRLRSALVRLIAMKGKYGALVPAEMTDFLHTVKDPETFVDLAAFSLCEDSNMKQKLLETLDVRQRLELFSAQLRSEIAALRLHAKLQGDLSDEHISHN